MYKHNKDIGKRSYPAKLSLCVGSPDIMASNTTTTFTSANVYKAIMSFNSNMIFNKCCILLHLRKRPCERTCNSL